MALSLSSNRIKSMWLRRRYDVPEHHDESLAPVDRRFAEPFEDGVNLVPDGLPFGTFAGQVEIGQHAFESVDHLGMALKPWIGATLLNEGFYLVHRAFTNGPPDVAPLLGYSGS
jgi:hypothetical protein